MLVLPAQLTHAQALSCLRMLVQGLPAQAGNPVAVDASALEDFDSAALAVLIEFRCECLSQGKQMVVRGLSQSLARLAALYGIEELLAVA